MYKSWEKFTLANLEKQDCKLLDLAGGSGRLAVLLAKDGVNVKVADFSDEMFSLADQHQNESNVDLQLVQVDMRDLSVLEKYDAITCYADSFCYLDDEPDLLQTFSEKVNFNLHIIQYKGSVWKNDILFRNYMRTHPKDRFEYSSLKEKILEDGVDDLLGYSKKKSKFIKAIYKKMQ